MIGICYWNIFVLGLFYWIADYLYWLKYNKKQLYNLQPTQTKLRKQFFFVHEKKCDYIDFDYVSFYVTGVH